MPELSLRFKSREVSRIPVATVTTRIGRDHECELHIDNVGVSRIHATIQVQNGQCVLVDNESQNGTFVNGHRVQSFVLVDGAEIQIGKHVICYHANSGPALPSSQRPPPKGRPAKTLWGMGNETPEDEQPKPKTKNVMQTMHMSDDQVARAIASGQMAKGAARAPAQQIAPPVVQQPAAAPQAASSNNMLLFGALGCAALLGLALVGVVAFVVLTGRL